MNGLQYFTIGAGAVAIVIIAAYILLLLWWAGKRVIVWASGKLANLFFGSVPGGRR